MSITASRIMAYGLLFLFTLGSGVWLSHSGRPFNTVIFTTHKLIALATLIVIGKSIHNLSKSVDIQAVALAVVVIMGLIFLALVVSGSLLSIEKFASQAALRVHQIMPLLALIASSTALYLLISSKS